MGSRRRSVFRTARRPSQVRVAGQAHAAVSAMTMTTRLLWAAWVAVGLPLLCISWGTRDVKHVRVLIRTHQARGDLLRSLVWNLRAQAMSLRDVNVDFVLVPTEPGTIPALQAMQSSLSEGRDVFVHHLPDSFFEEAAVAAQAYRCSRKQRKAYQKQWGAETTVKYCDYDNHVYYQATDRALHDVLEHCRKCTHVLVTNSDNSYHPEFLEKVLEANQDLVAVDFVTQGQNVNVSLGVGGIDLGAVLFSKSILSRIGGYTQALPERASPKDVHDADYWFVQKGLDEGGSLVFLHSVLFYHH